mmetsp:Transcript_16099/g.24264  ORF Transcript_16099/g.24264 Transcript_16099/m.24264 type:complete len:288 (-) Transcript_16099:64-927(-)
MERKLVGVSASDATKVPRSEVVSVAAETHSIRPITEAQVTKSTSTITKSASIKQLRSSVIGKVPASPVIVIFPPSITLFIPHCNSYIDSRRAIARFRFGCSGRVRGSSSVALDRSLLLRLLLRLLLWFGLACLGISASITLLFIGPQVLPVDERPFIPVSIIIPNHCCVVASSVVHTSRITAYNRHPPIVLPIVLGCVGLILVDEDHGVVTTLVSAEFLDSRVFIAGGSTRENIIPGCFDVYFSAVPSIPIEIKHIYLQTCSIRITICTHADSVSQQQSNCPNHSWA